jgi:hypothetical protein
MRIGGSRLFMIICSDRRSDPSARSWRHPRDTLELLVHNAQAAVLSSSPAASLQLVIAKQEARGTVPKT